jgi:pyruvate dehydrogenase E2 component (dihydrolipoamide acetyltransferase)
MLRSKAESAGVRLTVLPFIVRALVEALEEHPYLNASIDEEAQVILLHKSFNIGIATATDEGLVVPVIHGADRLGVLELARRVEELTSLARRRRLKPEDMRKGTFTITNVGPAGGWFGTSIIRHPESAILGVGRMTERPVVRDGRVMVGTVLPLALTFDHRVIDGDAALAFVQALRERLESPEQLMRDEPR